MKILFPNKHIDCNSLPQIFYSIETTERHVGLDSTTTRMTHKVTVLTLNITQVDLNNRQYIGEDDVPIGEDDVPIGEDNVL